MKTIKGNLILTEDTTFNEDIVVEGHILAQGYSINAKNINALNINALNIYALNIYALNIYAHNIYAQDIKAWDINAWDINAENIEYYAVCFAYKNIVCNSIKGTRENCKHFVLDGTIKIKGENK